VELPKIIFVVPLGPDIYAIWDDMDLFGREYLFKLTPNTGRDRNGRRDIPKSESMKGLERKDNMPGQNEFRLTG